MHIKNHFLILLFLAPLSLFAQKVERGLSYLDKNEKQYIQWLIDIGQIISPSGQEQERAEAVAAIMREIGLQEVRVNEMPNAIGIIPGKSNKSIVFISTLGRPGRSSRASTESRRASLLCRG
jgi:hypothetical protein